MTKHNPENIQKNKNERKEDHRCNTTVTSRFNLMGKSCPPMFSAQWRMAWCNKPAAATIQIPPSNFNGHLLLSSYINPKACPWRVNHNQGNEQLQTNDGKLVQRAGQSPQANLRFPTLRPGQANLPCQALPLPRRQHSPPPPRLGRRRRHRPGHRRRNPHSILSSTLELFFFFFGFFLLGVFVVDI